MSSVQILFPWKEKYKIFLFLKTGFPVYLPFPSIEKKYISKAIQP